MKKLSKPMALLFFVGIYAVAFAMGYFAAEFFPGSTAPFWQYVLVLDVVATLFIWVVGLMIRNASIYDPYWSVFPPIILLFWLVKFQIPLTLAGGVLLLTVIIWSVRLTYNFIINFDGFSYQDWRYIMFKEKNPKLWLVTNLFGINLMPTLIVLIQLFAGYLILTSSASVTILFLLGAFVSLMAAAVQFVSDKQMKDFRENHAEQKAVMKKGLWAYSRHPNYFGEVSFWWGLWIMYVGITGQIDFFLIPPILMTMLFVFISIPMMEKKILRTRPEYKEIQEKISMLLPVFWKRPQNEDEIDSKS